MVTENSEITVFEQAKAILEMMEFIKEDADPETIKHLEMFEDLKKQTNGLMDFTLLATAVIKLTEENEKLKALVEKS